MSSIKSGFIPIAVIAALTGCGVTTNQTSTAHGNVVSNTIRTTSSSSKFTPLPAQPEKVVVVKNGSQKTLTAAAVVSGLVRAFNQAAEEKRPTIHCNAMSQDTYRVTFVYAGHKMRAFTNQGGACRPMVDLNSGLKFPSSNLLNKLDN